MTDRWRNALISLHIKICEVGKKCHFRQNIQTEISRRPVIKKSCNIACWNRHDEARRMTVCKCFQNRQISSYSKKMKNSKMQITFHLVIGSQISLIQLTFEFAQSLYVNSGQNCIFQGYFQNSLSYKPLFLSYPVIGF